MANITFNVEKKLGVLGERKNNNMELRLISWNGKPAKYDIRGWYVSGGEERMTKGVTLSEQEMVMLYQILSGVNLEDETERVFGEIPQTVNYHIRIHLDGYGYKIDSFSGNFRMKGVALNKGEVIELLNILSGLLDEEPVEAPKPVKPKKETVKTVTSIKTEKTEAEKVIHALTSIPVNDGNYPIKTATIEQLKAAIAIMEAKPAGNKTRLDRCKAKLRQLESQKNADKIVNEISSVTDASVKMPEDKVTNTVKSDKKQETENIIQFPKKDNTRINKLQPTGEHHSYEEAETKLNKEREMFKGDRDTEYVIDGILEACISDQELLDNVMRPEKSYVGAFQYFANKAREGYCMRVGNVAVMTADTALKYAIDYFNSEEPKKPTKAEAKVRAKAETVAKKKETETKKVVEIKKNAPAKTTRGGWKKGGRK